MASDQRLLIVSPHLDDAVLSCGLLMAVHPGATVCTVFTAPPHENMSTDWDRQSGFTDAFEAMQARKAEDVRALALLNAQPFHLPFCDAQYLSSPSNESLAAALEQMISRLKPPLLFIPMGLYHSDHTLVTDACLTVMKCHAQRPFQTYVYEDVPYRNMPGIAEERRRVLDAQGFTAYPADAFPTEYDARHHQTKHAAIAAYQSQLRAFGPDGLAGLHSAERYWRLDASAIVPASSSSDDRHNACSTLSSHR
ncbi:PIG-L family deacetylase [Paraburkholderia sp. PREW-6R]|uniref:PIG-L deacetylase family protein n=1 Tax=Paraburkholderia sp. PREW-6R TaxID=3141544 RepID=UPI0031F512BE